MHLSPRDIPQRGSMRFKNPSNGYIEQKSVPALWALLFGGLYFLASGLWAPAVVWVVLAIILYASMGPPATVLMLIVAVVYSVHAPGIVRSAYLRKGWVELGSDENEATSKDDSDSPWLKPVTESTTKKCPSCAEESRKRP